MKTVSGKASTGASPNQPLAVTVYPRWKRSMDVAGSVLALPLLALVTFVVWLLMAIVSPGPVFFRQERVGYLGKRFRIFKFRSMYPRAETRSHQQHVAELMRSSAPMQKMDGQGDTRLLPGGWLLRASGLDELPQILNVLIGDMSLVGPRPCIPYEWEQYSSRERKRFSSVPGLTGLWQVSGKNRTTFEEMIRLDIEYASRVSPQLDLKIMMLTVPALISQMIDVRRERRGPVAKRSFGAKLVPHG